MMALWRRLWRVGISCGLTTSGLIHGQSLPGFTRVGESWTYNPGDGGAVISGILSTPGTNGSWPAILISHGKGGSAAGFSLPKAHVMTNWGAVCIGPNYTHTNNSNLPENEGWCPENSRRARACLTILASLGYVNTNRIAAYGNSMGAFVTAGLCGQISNQIHVAAITAGGASGTTDPDYAAPATEEVQGVRAPFLMLHGTADTTVPSGQSATLRSILTSNAVPTDRILFDGIGHDLHNNPATQDTVYQEIRNWFAQWGLFGERPKLALSIVPTNPDAQFSVRWERAAFVTTVECSSNALGPFEPVAVVTNGREWVASSNLNSPRQFFRVRQAE